MTMYFTPFYYLKSSTDSIHDFNSFSRFQVLDHLSLHFLTICFVVSDKISLMFSPQNIPPFTIILAVLKWNLLFIFLYIIASFLLSFAFFHVNICLSLRGRTIFYRHFAPENQPFTPADTPASWWLTVFEEDKVSALLLRGIIHMQIMTS